MKRQAVVSSTLRKNALFSEGTMNAETHSASEENFKVNQVCLALGTCVYV